MDQTPAVVKTQPSVLVVDDEEFMRSSVSALLEEYGYSVTTSPDATQALQVLQQDSIDIVLTDIK